MRRQTASEANAADFDSRLANRQWCLVHGTFVENSPRTTSGIKRMKTSLSVSLLESGQQLSMETQCCNISEPLDPKRVMIKVAHADPSKQASRSRRSTLESLRRPALRLGQKGHEILSRQLGDDHAHTLRPPFFEDKGKTVRRGPSDMRVHLRPLLGWSVHSSSTSECRRSYSRP